MDQVYSNVPDGAILRQLCSWVLSKQVVWQGRTSRIYEEYESVFSSHSDLGRDFFKWTTSGEPATCDFHDHSNITNPVEAKDHVCPYSDIHFPAPQA